MVKNKFYRGVFIATIMFAFLGVFFGASFNRKSITTSALSYGTKTDYYSQEYADAENHKTIFSLEKVYYNPEYANIANTGANNILGSNLTQDSQFGYSLENNNFYNIEKRVGTDLFNKYVVDNNDFVFLSNSNSKIIDGYNYQEYMLMTLGGYYLEDPLSIDTLKTNASVVDGGNNIGASLYNINITLYINGVIQTNVIPRYRSYTVNGRDYCDLVWFFNLNTFLDSNSNPITGYYKFDISYGYRSGDYTYATKTYDFGFYLINADSYNQTISNTSYNSAPEFYLADDLTNANNFSNEDTNFDFDLGSSKNLPTLTYDYTLFNLRYAYVKYNVTYNVEVNYVQENSTDYIEITTSALSKTTTYRYAMYNSKNNTHLLTLVFSDVGKYIFNFNYIYTGFLADGINGSVIIEDDNLVKNFDLDINGYSLVYAKTDYYQADLRYYNFSDDGISNLIVVGGYEEVDGKSFIGWEYDSILDRKILTETELDSSLSLGLKYETSKSSMRTGTAQSVETSEKNLINSTDNYDTIIENLSNSYLEQIDKESYFARTNQGGLWLDLYGEFDLDYCKYYFSATLPESLPNSATEYLSYTKGQMFSGIGYYVLIVRYSNADNSNLKGTQAFAFRVSSKSPNVKIWATNEANLPDNEDSSTRIYTDGITNKNVYLTWNESGRFESVISATYYYSSTYQDESSIINNTPYTYQNKGGMFTQNGTYYVVVNYSSKSKTMYFFTIDKTPISNIRILGVKSTIINGYTSYQLERNADGSLKDYSSKAMVNTSITLTWDDKTLSGAKINAYYRFIPFIVDNSKSVQTIISNNEVWINTTYKIGAISENVAISKPKSMTTSSIDADNVLSASGIYLFTLEDEAGNIANYMIVIDNIKNQYMFYDDLGSIIDIDSFNYILNNDITISYGSHKSVNIGNVNSIDYLADYINFLYNNSSNSINYAPNNNITNIAVLKSAFKTYDNNYYYVVKNNNILLNSITDNASLQKEIVVDTNKDYSVKVSDLNLDDLEGLYSFYLVAENQTNLTDITNSVNNFTFEINYDNSKGRFYSNNVSNSDELYYYSPKITTFYFELDKSQSVDINNFEGNINDLIKISGQFYEIVGRYTFNGSKYINIDNNQEYLGNVENLIMCDDLSAEQNKSVLNSSNVSNADLVTFRWINSGIDKYTISKLVYSYYPLNYDSSSRNYPYAETPASGYSNIDLIEGSSTIEIDGEVYNVSAPLHTIQTTFVDENHNSVVKTVTAPGMYVITRQYVGSLESFADDNDDLIRTYVIFVDRNGIVHYESNERLGAFISVSWGDDLNNVIFDNFNLTLSDDALINGNTYNYLTTDIMPAVLNISASKYYDENGVRTYNTLIANMQLKLSIYYYESGTNNSYSEILLKELIVDENGLIDLSNIEYLNKSGVYEFVLTDGIGGYTENWTKSSGNEFRFAITVSPKEIEIDKYYAVNFDNILNADNSLNEVFRLNSNSTTNQNYLIFEFEENYSANPSIKYDSVDPSSIKIFKDDVEIFAWSTENFDNGIIKVVKAVDTPWKYYIILDCSSVNEGETSTYTIYCHKYSDKSAYENLQYYETYQDVIIDKQPDDININNLISSDNQINNYFVQLYNQGEISSIAKTNSSSCFDTQNVYYYSIKLSYDYLLSANENTSFASDGLEKVFIRAINISSSDRYKSLSLLPSEAEYYSNVGNSYLNFSENQTDYNSVILSSYTSLNVPKTYGQLINQIFNISENNFYEIIEKDFAGNYTSYLIYLVNNDSLSNSISNNGNTVQHNSNTTFYLNSIEGSFDLNLYDYSSYISIKNSTSTKSFEKLINTHTLINDLKDEIVEFIINNDSQNYTLTLWNRLGVNYSINLNYYTQRIELNINTVQAVQQNENWILDLTNVNTHIGEANCRLDKLILVNDTNKTYTIYIGNLAGNSIIPDDIIANLQADGYILNETIRSYDFSNSVINLKTNTKYTLYLIDNSDKLYTKITDTVGFNSRIYASSDIMGVNIQNDNIVSSLGDGKYYTDLNMVVEFNAIRYDRVNITNSITNSTTNIILSSLDDSVVTSEQFVRIYPVDIIDGQEYYYYIYKNNQNIYRIVFLKQAEENTPNSTGRIANYIVVLNGINNEPNSRYEFTIDNYVPELKLLNTYSENLASRIVAVNYELNINNYPKSNFATSEKLRLEWGNFNTDYFDNEVYLYVLVDNEFVLYNSSSVIDGNISNMSGLVLDSPNIYVVSFKTSINGKLVFSKNIGFEIYDSSTKNMYDVKANGETLSPVGFSSLSQLTTLTNYFVVNEISTDLFIQQLIESYENSHQGESISINFDKNFSIPIYMSIYDMNIDVNVDKGVVALQLWDTSSITGSVYPAKLYQIKAVGDYYYETLIILVQASSNDMIESVSTNKGEIISSTGFSQNYLSANGNYNIYPNDILDEETLPSNVLGKIYVKFNSFSKASSYKFFERLNKIIVDVYISNDGGISYNYLKSIEGEYDENTNISYTYIPFNMSGMYMLKFRNTAGNILTYLDNGIKKELNVKINVIYDVIANIKTNISGVDSTLPIVNNGIFNNTVNVNVISNNSSLYSFYSRDSYVVYNNVKTILYNSKYVEQGNNQSFIFTEYGNYRVVLIARSGLNELKTEFVFNIVNPNSATYALDLSNINNLYSIEKVTRTNKEVDCTDEFKNLLKQMGSFSGLITLDRLKENGLSSGIYNIYYRIVVDNQLTDNLIKFSVRFEDTEGLALTSSIKSGESTTKTITISYNTFMLFEQIGECKIVVKNSQEKTINEIVIDGSNLNVNQDSFNITESGTYFVQIQSLNGDIYSSIKVIKKTPLTTFTIVVIVAISILVLAVVIIFFKFRNKMKVR